MMRIVISFVLLVGFIMTPLQVHEAFGDQFGRTGSLILIIKSNKPKYNVNEPIFITLKISNHTTEPLFVNKRLNPLLDIQWDLFYENIGGNMKMLEAKPIALRPDDFVKLEVNEDWKVKLDDLATLVDGRLHVGRYAIRLTISNEEKVKGNETWTGLAVTNQLWIEVVPSQKV